MISLKNNKILLIITLIITVVIIIFFLFPNKRKLNLKSKDILPDTTINFTFHSNDNMPVDTIIKKKKKKIVK